MANDFKPTIGAKVPKVDADEWIKEYDDKKRKDKLKDTKSIFFGKDRLQEILNTPGASGISFFFALKPSAHAKKDVDSLVLVATKEDGTLLWPTEAVGKDAPASYAWDEGLPCPPQCPPSST